MSKFSCHDPKNFKGIPKGVGYRLRITNSTNETFKENVELYSRSMAISGYDYQMVKREMMKFEHVDPVELVKQKGNKSKPKRFKPGCRAFYISNYDPRLPHPRNLITRNYEILARSEKAKSLFPRGNLVAASRRLPNLGEILSPTLQPSNPDPPAPGQNDDNHPARRGAGDRRQDEPDPPAPGQHDDNHPARRGAGDRRQDESDPPAPGQDNSTHPARRGAGNRRQDENKRPTLPPRGQESCSQPARRQNKDILPARKRRKGIVELEDGMEHQGRDISEQEGGVASQGATMEQPTCSTNSSQRLEQEPEQPVKRKTLEVFPDNIQRNGSFHCDFNKHTQRCDFCNHMVETRSIFSSHFQRRHAVAGHNVHLKATEKVKLRWFVYLQECLHPDGIYQYVGSTSSVTERWANTKSKCVAGTTKGSGIEKHFNLGCTAKSDNLRNIRNTLLEHFDTTSPKLKSANHKPGPGCRCTECSQLKNIEDKWIFRMGTMFGNFGLNNRNEVTNKARAGF